jgi:ATP-dependent helicase/nuclease subunit B
MSPNRSGAAPRLVDALGGVARKHRVARKLVVAPSHSVGRELLRRLALEGEGWVGFEVTTPHRLARRLALGGLERSGFAVLDPFDHQSLLDRALDAALASDQGGLGELSEGVGFREKVHGAVNALRLAGIGPQGLDAARFSQWEKKLFLLRVVQRYERLLAEGRKADPAAVLRLALAALEEAGGKLPDALDVDVVLLTSGLGMRGLDGRLVGALTARGAKVLETDPVAGLEAPEATLWSRSASASPGSCLYAPEQVESDANVLDIDFFSASSIEAELREVLRRVVGRGLAWDQVEIVTPDPAAYGSALHALARRLDVPVTYAVGLPIGRTRVGRVVRAYLDWIEEGFQATPIRRLLEAGDLRPPRSKGSPAPAALARRFRSLRVGWGRKRYRSQLRVALVGVDRMDRGQGESEEVFARRTERARSELEALKAILYPALKATPAVPDRMGEAGTLVSPAELARGLKAFLRRVPRGRGPDRAAREEVGRVLDRVEAVLTRRTEFRSAVTIVRRHLELRVRPDIFGDDPDGPGAPWSSTGGALHLSDLEHGGFAGRRAVFLVGLDTDQVPGVGAQDPVLLDSDRRVLGRDLPTSGEVLRERVFRFAALFARLRGTVTMSYCAWQATEARSVGPSSVMLQALRLARRDPELTFEDLREHTTRVVSAIPHRERPHLDADDVWMSVLGSGPVMMRGVEAVRASHPWLDRGLHAAEQRRQGTPGPVHGVIEPRPERLDPRRDDSVVVSASRLEALGTCPLRYLHASILRAYPPDDPELDPDVWLDPRRRGSLLHEVYDTTLREAASRGVKPEDGGFETLALDALRTGVGRMRDEVPSPGEGTFAREEAALREDVRSFVRMIRELKPEYVALELRFGLGDDEPVIMDLERGTLRVRGAIDRIDQDLAGLHVVDYKTGSTFGYGAEAFNGGRRLQHAIYAHVAERRLGGEVVDGQYHFPTRRGQNEAFVYDRRTLAQVTGLIDLLLDGVAAGHFVPTDDPDDCTFCDFAEVCRVRKSYYGKVDSPVAEWSKEHTNLGIWPAFQQLKRARTFE